MQVFWVQTFLTHRIPSPNFFKLSVPGGLRIFRAFASLFSEKGTSITSHQCFQWIELRIQYLQPYKTTKLSKISCVLVLPSSLFVQKQAFCQAAQFAHTCSEAVMKRSSLTDIYSLLKNVAELTQKKHQQ